MKRSLSEPLNGLIKMCNKTFYMHELEVREGCNNSTRDVDVGWPGASERRIVPLVGEAGHVAAELQIHFSCKLTNTSIMKYFIIINYE